MVCDLSLDANRWNISVMVERVDQCYASCWIGLLIDNATFCTRSTGMYDTLGILHLTSWCILSLFHLYIAFSIFIYTSLFLLYNLSFLFFKKRLRLSSCTNFIYFAKFFTYLNESWKPLTIPFISLDICCSVEEIRASAYADSKLKKPEMRYGVNGNDNSLATSAFNVLTVRLHSWGSARHVTLKGLCHDSWARWWNAVVVDETGRDMEDTSRITFRTF